VDRHGNARWQPFGSVVVDTPLTPDYIAPLSAAAGVGDGSWMDTGCTLLGTDPRITRGASAGRWQAQSLYATWDHEALRLAWTGANWSGDGDLFIYLDTGPGGTTGTFTPESVAITGTTVVLPSDMQADALIWVPDSQTATLLRWNGSAWSANDNAIYLDDAQFRFDGGRNGGQTDLYLPFERLGRRPAGPAGDRRRRSGARNRAPRLGHAAAGEPDQQRSGQPAASVGSLRQHHDAAACLPLGCAD
jgi:hypothetical protein